MPPPPPTHTPTPTHTTHTPPSFPRPTYPTRPSAVATHQHHQAKPDHLAARRNRARTMAPLLRALALMALLLGEGRLRVHGSRDRCRVCARVRACMYVCWGRGEDGVAGGEVPGRRGGVERRKRVVWVEG